MEKSRSLPLFLAVLAAAAVAVVPSPASAQAVDVIYVGPAFSISAASSTHSRVRVAGTCEGAAGVKIRLGAVGSFVGTERPGSVLARALGPEAVCRGGSWQAAIDVRNDMVGFGQRLLLVVKAARRGLDVYHPKALVAVESGDAFNGSTVLLESSVVY